MPALRPIRGAHGAAAGAPPSGGRGGQRDTPEETLRGRTEELEEEAARFEENKAESGKGTWLGTQRYAMPDGGPLRG